MFVACYYCLAVCYDIGDILAIIVFLSGKGLIIDTHGRVKVHAMVKGGTKSGRRNKERCHVSELSYIGRLISCQATQYNHNQYAWVKDLVQNEC